jgi:hypothetical protein
MTNEKTQNNELNNGKTPSFSLLLDPPECGWELSSDALIFSLKAFAEFMRDQELWDPENPETFVNLMRVMQPSLLLITSQLTQRMGLVDTNVEKKIGQLLVEKRDQRAEGGAS